MRARTVIAALLLIPLADALLLVVVADAIGWQATVLLVVLTGLVGMLLVRAEGRHTLRRLQERAARGEVPTDELLDGALLVAAGAFLLTPGVVTDAIGFALAIPLSRYPIRAALKRWVVVPKLDAHTDGFVSGTVWTAGFPDGGDDDAAGPFGGVGSGGGPGDGFPGGGAHGSGDEGRVGDDGTGGDGADDGDVYDVDPDDYAVDDGENR